MLNEVFGKALAERIVKFYKEITSIQLQDFQFSSSIRTTRHKKIDEKEIVENILDKLPSSLSI